MDLSLGLVPAGLWITGPSAAELSVPAGSVEIGGPPERTNGPFIRASGAGRHWWRTLSAVDYTDHQLPDPAVTYSRPLGW
jgi:hypothetical protein